MTGCAQNPAKIGRGKSEGENDKDWKLINYFFFNEYVCLLQWQDTLFDV